MEILELMILQNTSESPSFNWLAIIAGIVFLAIAVFMYRSLRK